MAFWFHINSVGTLVNFTHALHQITPIHGPHSDLATIKSIPIPGLCPQKTKLKSKDTQPLPPSSYPYFSSLIPPISKEEINCTWLGCKPIWSQPKSSICSSPLVKRWMIAITTINLVKNMNHLQMALLIKLHYINCYHPLLLKTSPGAILHYELSIIFTIHCKFSAYFEFWDPLIPNSSTTTNTTFLSPLEISSLATLKNLSTEHHKFNQKILSLVEKSKYNDINFNLKSKLSSSIKIALNNLLWVSLLLSSLFSPSHLSSLFQEMELHQECQCCALHPPPPLPDGQKHVLCKDLVPRGEYKCSTAVSPVLSPPPTAPVLLPSSHSPLPPDHVKSKHIIKDDNAVQTPRDDANESDDSDDTDSDNSQEHINPDCNDPNHNNPNHINPDPNDPDPNNLDHIDPDHNDLIHSCSPHPLPNSSTSLHVPPTGSLPPSFHPFLPCSSPLPLDLPSSSPFPSILWSYHSHSFYSLSSPSHYPSQQRD
ncbi:hypothetical protein BS47DRAFT_1391270 [Hydnum rufescens UP504]|uniref:Uncharacterized protein n=1 Tax=Hydnum rufescens UP504 TaxID=1448309 RepID=A0A9P6B2I9_9AGAM|nr:hypothetical protein BS47DRAFT_1391270 [Hydnum rufescens UP504]